MREHKQDLQNNPLLPGYDFNAYLVAGCTQIEKSNELDFPIYRPNGMNGYILNLTIKGKGSVFQNDHQFDCKVGDLLYFLQMLFTIINVHLILILGIINGFTLEPEHYGKIG